MHEETNPTGCCSAVAPIIGLFNNVALVTRPVEFGAWLGGWMGARFLEGVGYSSIGAEETDMDGEHAEPKGGVSDTQVVKSATSAAPVPSETPSASGDLGPGDGPFAGALGSPSEEGFA